MQIIAGKFGGRQLASPRGNRTRPMSQRVRAALFNMLGDISGLTVLDAYAGSGALGLEAISRGAVSALLIDIDHTAARTISDNIKALNLQTVAKSIRANISSWSQQNPQKKFDIVLADPPYDKIDISTLEVLRNHLNNNGLMVLSHSGRESAPTVNGVVVVDNRRYGDAALAFYRLAVD